MADSTKNDSGLEKANQAEQQEKAEVLYRDEDGKTQSRKAASDAEQTDGAEMPEPLGTDRNALAGATGDEEYMTHEDAKKAEAGEE